MGLKALLYAYILGGITFIPLVIAGLIFITIYTSVPVGELDVAKKRRGELEKEGVEKEAAADVSAESAAGPSSPTTADHTRGATDDVNDLPKARKGWLTMRRTFEELPLDGGYVGMVRNFLDARSKDPKRSRPRDMWYVVLKGKVLFLYEDESMSECEAAIELSGHDVIIYPEGLPDGELFAKRNAICLRPKEDNGKSLPSVTRDMKLEPLDIEAKLDESSLGPRRQEKEKERLVEEEEKAVQAREEAFDRSTPWFIFVRSNVEMEDWYHAFVHASDNPAQTPTLSPLQKIFLPADMNHLVSTLDEQPDVIPMRWLNAILGRMFYSFYQTDSLESFIIGRLMKKISKVKRPALLQDVVVTEVSVGNRTPTFSKPMLKELTKEGDASMEVHVYYKGEIRITLEATANINLGSRFKPYTVKLVLAAVMKECEGNLLVKIKRPPSNRLWYAFTQTPRMVLSVEPIVSDRQITWGVILSTIESRIVEVIQESVVMPNMDDIQFFETLGTDYQHRGGIWSDAGRRVRERPMQDATAEPAMDPSGVALPSEATSEQPLTTEQKSKSIADIPLSTTPDPSPVASSSTFPLPSSAEDSTKPTRRRTWFSHSRDTSKEEAKEEAIPASEVQRGRPSDIDTPATTRSQSTPGAPLTTQPEEDETASNETLLQPISRRSSSRHSSTSDRDSQPPTSPRTPDPPSRSSESTIGTSPSSFLSTLKSRAATADKQALSNQARETMKKWGVNVNWGLNQKKDSDDHSDPGSLPRSRTESLNSTLAQRARTSYAEMRAAVNERRNRTDGSEISTTPPTPSTPSGSQTSLAITIPTNGRSKSISIPPTGANGGSGGGNSYEGPGLRPEARDRDRDRDSFEESPVPSPIFVQPQAKTMSIPGIHASHRGAVQSMGYVAPAPPSPERPKANPMIRLWKNSNASQSSTGNGTPQSESPAPAEEREKEHPSSSPSSSPISKTAPGSPPPLPLRRPSASISRPPLEATKVGSDVSTQSAEVKLKSIASKDENKRASLEPAGSLTAKEAPVVVASLLQG